LAQNIEKPEIKQAKIRGDGNLTDNDNFIIGIRNKDDPRADNFSFFYYGVDRKGNVTDYSVYKVYQDRNSTSPVYLQEKIVVEVKNYDGIINESTNAYNIILLVDEKIFFNGEVLESGSVASGGVVVYTNEKLYYNGQKIQSGTKVLNGVIING